MASNIIWMTINLENKVKSISSRKPKIFPYYLYDILDYFMIPDVIFDVKMSSYPFKKSKSQNSDTEIGCPSKETHLYAFWDQHSHLIEISDVLGNFWTVFGRFGVHDVTKGIMIL